MWRRRVCDAEAGAHMPVWRGRCIVEAAASAGPACAPAQKPAWKQFVPSVSPLRCVTTGYEWTAVHKAVSGVQRGNAFAKRQAELYLGQRRLDRVWPRQVNDNGNGSLAGSQGPAPESRPWVSCEMV